MTDAGVLACDAIILIVVVGFLAVLVYSIYDWVMEVWFAEEDHDDPLPPYKPCSYKWSYSYVNRPPYDWEDDDDLAGQLSGQS